MDINKTFYVETTADKETRIYNAGKKFFSGGGVILGSRNRSTEFTADNDGLMKRFGSPDAAAKNAYISRLKKDGWLPLSIEDVNKTSVSEHGVITTYPFKYKRGYMTLEKIEAAAGEMNYRWERADHGTNPFSALKDYASFVNQLADGGKYDVRAFNRQIAAYAERINEIGAIDLIEIFFTMTGYVPDPRRFNKTVKELWQYYASHLRDCCRVIAEKHFAMPNEDFSVDALFAGLCEIKTLQSFVSDKAYEHWINRNAGDQ